MFCGKISVSFEILSKSWNLTDEFNAREYRKGNQKQKDNPEKPATLRTQGELNKIKTQRNMRWTPLYPN